MTKQVSFKREILLEGSKPHDTWLAENVTPVEAVELAMTLLDKTIQNLVTINGEQIKVQADVIRSASQNVPGFKEYLATLAPNVVQGPPFRQ